MQKIRRLFLKASVKSQSAMEYLMTYGWAILIIAIVLAALFSLGVFSPTAYTPKASPGSCQVFRPNGPGTTSFINLEGICNGELPQYVAQFNGVSTYVEMSQIPSSTLGANAKTVAAWIYPTSYSGEDGIVVTGPSGGGSTGQSFRFVINSNGQLGLDVSDGIAYTSLVAPLNKWSFVVATYYNNNYLVYLQATSQSLSLPVQNLVQGYIYIGFNFINNYYFSGSIANVQIYNTALSSNDIQALYQEGIGGAPINLQNLVGWWPLNSNTNDYSGNDNNGVASGVTYSSSWYSGYTPS